MSDDEVMDWLDGLRECTGSEEAGMWTDNDYFLISDRNGDLWQTETLKSGEQVKIKREHYEFV